MRTSFVIVLATIVALGTSLPTVTSALTINLQDTVTLSDGTQLSATAGLRHNNASSVKTFAEATRKYAVASTSVICPSAGTGCDPVGDDASALASVSGFFQPSFTAGFLDWAATAGITSVPITVELIADVYVSGDAYAYTFARASAGFSYGNILEQLLIQKSTETLAPSVPPLSLSQRKTVRLDYDFQWMYQYQQDPDGYADYLGFLPSYYKTAYASSNGLGAQSSIARAFADPIVSIDPTWQYAAQFTNIGFTLGDGTTGASLVFDKTVSAVPVPAGFVLMLGGLAALAGLGRRKLF